MPALSETKVVSLRGSEPAMNDSQIHEHTPQVPQWRVKEVDGEKRLERVFTFPDFGQALAFTDRVGAIAQAEDHHPQLTTEWGRVTVDWWTHKVHGLHMNDFVMAAKTDGLYG